MKRLILFSVLLLSILDVHAQNTVSMATSDSLFARGVELYHQKKYKEAVPLFAESDRIDKILLDSTSNRRDYSSMWLASCYYNLGDSIKAQETNENFNLPPIDRRLTVESDSLTTHGYNLIKKGRISDALDTFFQVAQLEKQALGEDNYSYGNTMNNIASLYNYSKKYDEAIKYATEALNICKKNFGIYNQHYLYYLNKVSSYNYSAENYTESIKYTTESLNIIERVLGKEHPDYAVSLNNLALLNCKSGNYRDAISFGIKALNITEMIVGKKNSAYASCLSNLGGYNCSLGNYTEAIRLGTEALNIRECVRGKKHPDYAASLGDLANYNYFIGNYTEAIRLGTEALNIREHVLGKEHLDYATSLNNLAGYYSSLGNYTEAIRLGTEALNITESVVGKENTDYATSLNNLATYNSLFGNYTEATCLVTEALNIIERVLGKEHPDYATFLSNLAHFNALSGNYTEAIRIGTEALDIREKALSKDHPYFAQSLNNLAEYNSSLCNYVEAIRLGTEALNIIEQVFGKEHPYYAASLNNLASYNSDLGNYTEAIRLGTEAVTIAEKVLDKEHPDLIIQKSNLADYYFTNKDFKKTEQYVIEVNNANRNYIRKTFANLTSRERGTFWNTQKYWFENAVNKYAHYINSRPIVSDGYNVTLLAKGILLNSERDFSDRINESGDEKAIEAFGQLRTTRSMLNKLYEKPISERFMNTDSIENVAQQLERELIGRSKVYGDFTRNMTITWQDVQKKLQPKDVAVEFVSFHTESDSIIYSAYVLTPQMKTPQMVKLFEKKDLDSIPSYRYYTTDALSTLVWRPLDKYIRDSKDIYFAPAGELYNIAIEYLPHYKKASESDTDPENENGSNPKSDTHTLLLSDVHDFHRLSSTRELAVIRETSVVKNASLYGGLQYNADSTILVADAQKYPVDIYSLSRDFDITSIADSLDMRAGVNYLSGTMVEVENIEESLKKIPVNADMYTGLNGTEGSFKALSGKRMNLLHIATHGFYWTESEAGKKSYLRFLQPTLDNEKIRHVEDKTLTRSGLFLTGANLALKGEQLPENTNDGILTAKEIASLDFRGLDMVVLSACQTGLGEITGEGVFGLQRGFKKAGANTLLMSLWKVNDKATQILMTSFYEAMLAGTNKHDALIEAQKKVREYEEPVEGAPGRVKHPFEHPRFWAAFILLDALN